MLGFATIGQAPRDDILSSMLGETNPAVLQAGALDQLGNDDISNLRPREGEQVLVSRLADGSQVWLSKARVVPHLQAAVDRLVANGAQVVCVLCTGAFPALHAPVRLVFPDQLVTAVVSVLLPRGVLGVLMPDADQAEMMQAKWSANDRDLALAVASPYRHGPAAFYDAANQLNTGGANLIVMDCMGYTRDMQAWVASGCAVPVVLSNALIGSILLETVGATPVRPVPTDARL
jgi:protein AroM